MTFDVLVLLPSITKKNYHIKTVIANYSIYELVLEGCNGNKITLRCSYKLSSLSLSSLGSLVKIDKLPFPKILISSKFIRHRRIHSFHFHEKNSFTLFKLHFKDFMCSRTKRYDMVEVYKRYCALDAIIAKKGVISLLKKLPFRVLKSSPLSASSIAVRTALIHSNKIKLKIPQNIDKLFRNAYYGGRCEVFGNICAEETALHFDFKGMYSQCMLENLPHTSFKLIEYDFNIDRPGFYLIYFIQNEYMPVLPRRIDSKLKFVNGEGSGWY